MTSPPGGVELHDWIHFFDECSMLGVSFSAGHMKIAKDATLQGLAMSRCDAPVSVEN